MWQKGMGGTKVKSKHVGMGEEGGIDPDISVTGNRGN